MKTVRTAVGLLLAVWPAAGLGAAAEKPRDYKKELRQVQTYQRAKRYEQCIAACDKMLEHFTESWQQKEVTWLKIDAAVADSRYEAALATLDSLAKAHADDKKLQAEAAMRTAGVQRSLKKHDQAVATYAKLAESAAADQPDQAAEALLRMGDVLCLELRKPREGIASYQDVARKFGEKDPKRAAEGIRRVAVTHESQTKDRLKAAAAYRSLTDQYADLFDDHSLAGFFRKAIECLLAAEKPAEAAAVAAKAEADLKAPAEKAGFGARHGEILTAAGKPSDARAQWRRVLCAYPLEAKACRKALAGIVEAYRAESKWAEALGAARVLYDAAAGEQDLRAAAGVVAQAFLAVDGNLARANAFLSYQRFGRDGPDGKRGTDDDVAVNHLARVKYPPLSAAEEKLFQAAVEAQRANYDGHRGRGFLYVYWGKPTAGAASFLRAFKSADPARLPAASQELILVGMKAHTASFGALAGIFEYVTYGPKGKSGKEKLPDPFAGL